VGEHEEERFRRTLPDRTVEVAVIGGGCASLAAAFELTRPELKGAYHVTVYQVGWRLGGKGASGRGPADRIEEHGLHIWLGFYENAFRLIRECYEELGRDPEKCPLARWDDAFFQDSHVGVADKSGSEWVQWTTFFPPVDGHPGDPLGKDNPFTIAAYTKQAIKLVQALLLGVQTRGGSSVNSDAGCAMQRPNPREDRRSRQARTEVRIARHDGRPRTGGDASRHDPGFEPVGLSAKRIAAVTS
jgi:uncharacterized protein with NAD-binding domain and iron-sulfur cluster